MKCPACQTDSKKADRVEGRCPTCQRTFKLDPPLAGFSDYAIDALIVKLTDKRAYKLTKRQLAAGIERRLVAKRRSVRTVMLVLGIILTLLCGILLALGVLAVIVPFVIFSLIFGAIYASAGFEPSLPANIVRAYGSHPQEAEPRAELPVHAGQGKEFDLESYGFDRVIIVQGDDIAEMLVQNQFHFQHNAAIVSFDGYPAHVAKLVDKQIYENQATPVVLLHDATAIGYALAHHWLARRNLHPQRIIRAGLTPRQVGKTRPDSGPVGAVPPGLPSSDASWLAKHGVTIAALRPAQVMTLLFNAIQRRPSAELSSASGGDGVGFVVIDDGGYDFG